ncbi:invertase [Listeria ivanovii FSL F6-596]|nr:invertase [Listeria ivanovii FSL F6-596]
MEEEIAKSGILNGILIIERNTTKSSIKTFLLKRNSADSGYLEIGTQYICPVVDGKIRILNRDEDTSISFQTFGIKYQIIFSVQIISIS